VFLSAAVAQTDQIHALTAFVAWCLTSQGNQASTISGKLAAVQYFHRAERQLEIPIGAPLVNRALKGVEKTHVGHGTRPRVRLPISWETLLKGQSLILSWGEGGRVLWLCLALSFFLLTRSEEMFETSAAGIHPVHCLRRDDVTFYDEHDRVLLPLQWRRAIRADVRFRGHKADQTQRGSTLVRVREVANGPRSQIGAGGGAVALLVELMSVHMALPGSAPLCSFRQEGKGEVAVLGYRRALKALRQIVGQEGYNPMDFGLHSLRIGGATAMAAGGEISDRVVNDEGRWKGNSGSLRKYARNNPEDAGAVSKKLAKRSKV